MSKRKQIAIKKKESERSYFEDVEQQSSPSSKEPSVRKALLLSQSLDDQVKAYVYKKRTSGDIYYSQTALFREALTTFFNMHKD